MRDVDVIRGRVTETVGCIEQQRILIIDSCLTKQFEVHGGFRLEGISRPKRPLLFAQHVWKQEIEPTLDFELEVKPYEWHRE